MTDVKIALLKKCKMKNVDLKESCIDPMETSIWLSED